MHFYPPTPCGGAGYYTANLAEAFVRTGAKVSVLCTDQWGQGGRYLNGFVDETRNGVAIRRLHVNWKKASRPFDWLYDSPVLGEQTRKFLDQFQPDIVHVSSCYTLSARPIFVAKELNLPVVMHLHDYWPICARLTLLHKDYAICSGPDTAWKCQECLLTGTKAWQLASRVTQPQWRKRMFAALAKSDWATRQPGLRGMMGDLQRRRQFLIAATDRSDLLITPTHFAREMLEQHGVTKGRIQVIPYGNPLEWRSDVKRIPPQRSLRIGFLGNVIPIKGVHILIEAFQRLLHENQPIELAIWGNLEMNSDYVRSLQEQCPDGVVWGGRYQRSDLPHILRELDVIVVPSICYETQGIVIQEAFAASVPVIVSASSSLTESVLDGINGLHFEMGSVRDLADKLRRLVEETGLLDQFRSKVPSVRTIEHDVEEYSRLYAALLA